MSHVISTVSTTLWHFPYQEKNGACHNIKVHLNDATIANIRKY